MVTRHVIQLATGHHAAFRFVSAGMIPKSTVEISHRLLIAVDPPPRTGSRAWEGPLRLSRDAEMPFATLMLLSGVRSGGTHARAPTVLDSGAAMTKQPLFSTLIFATKPTA